MVDVFQEEETQIVDLELNCSRGTIIMKSVIFKNGRRLANALVSRYDRSKLVQNLLKFSQCEYCRGAERKLHRYLSNPN